MRIDRKCKKKASVVKPSIEGFLPRLLQGDKPAVVIEVAKNLEFTVKPGSCYNRELLRIKMRQKQGKQFGSPAETEKT